MLVSRPELQHADTDGAGPVKRRRPALSCVECRRRKVKCNRERPCGPCTQTKSLTCTYRPHPRGHGRSAGSPVTILTSDATRRGNNCSGDVDPHISSQQVSFDAMINRYIAPGIFGHHGKDTLAPLPKQSETGTKDVIQELRHRVRNLEERLDAINGPVDAASRGDLSGQFVKSRFYGESHWNNCIEPYEALGQVNIAVNTNTNRTEINKASELYATVAECKRMARTIKASRMLHPSVTPEVQESIPSRDICDQLVQAYLRTFEGVFRILHVPSFLKEYEGYWSNTTVAKPSVLLKILLVSAIGTPFYTGPEQPRLRASSPKWIQAAESWLSAPHEKSRLNMAGLQIQILLLLARQVSSVDGDLVWIRAGMLLRSAMHLGLHRDPSHLAKISVFHAEMRRRLWATVMEITVQSSLDIGMPPMISPGDYDTLPPSNINDEKIGEAETTSLNPKPLKECTQASLQIALYETIPLRLEIVRSINNLRFSLSYDETLRVGSQLFTTCCEKTQLHQSFLASAQITSFQAKLFDTMVRRFVLCLHRPFYARAKREPRYYYSRKSCLDAALSIAAPASPDTNGEEDDEDDWAKLLSHPAVGFLKSILMHSITTIYLELTAMLEEQHQNVVLAPASPPAPLPLPPHFPILYAILAHTQRVSKARLRNGETNAKGYLFLACTIARIDALVARADPDAAVLGAAREAVAESAALMREAYRSEQGVDIELGFQEGEFAGREGGRGEGADVTVVEQQPCGAGVEITGVLESGEGQEEMNWEVLMRAEGMDFGWGFEGTPESWFGWGWEVDGEAGGGGLL